MEDATDYDVQVLNFGAFIDGSQKQDIADAMFTSLRETGFVYLVNHSLPQEKIDAMFEWVSRSPLFVMDIYTDLFVSLNDFLICPWNPRISPRIRLVVSTIVVCTFPSPFCPQARAKNKFQDFPHLALKKSANTFTTKRNWHSTVPTLQMSKKVLNVERTSPTICLMSGFLMAYFPASKKRVWNITGCAGSSIGRQTTDHVCPVSCVTISS